MPSQCLNNHGHSTGSCSSAHLLITHISFEDFDGENILYAEFKTGKECASKGEDWLLKHLLVAPRHEEYAKWMFTSCPDYIHRNHHGNDMIYRIYMVTIGHSSGRVVPAYNAILFVEGQVGGGSVFPAMAREYHTPEQCVLVYEAYTAHWEMTAKKELDHHHRICARNAKLSLVKKKDLWKIASHRNGTLDCNPKYMKRNGSDILRIIPEIYGCIRRF